MGDNMNSPYLYIDVLRDDLDILVIGGLLDQDLGTAVGGVVLGSRTTWTGEIKLNGEKKKNGTAKDNWRSKESSMYVFVYCL